VTVDEPAIAAPAPVTTEAPEPPRTTQQQALDRYNGRLHTWRFVYAALVAAIVIALGVTVRVAWTHGETGHTTLHAIANPPPTVALRSPGTAPLQAWRNSEHTAIGTPFWGGTIVTYSAHAVHGRNALTGAITWSYTRTDRTVCQVIQDQGNSIALFDLHGNCDEVTTLDTQTGKRRWTRTLDKDNRMDQGRGVQRITGHPSYAVGDFTVLIYSPHVIYAIDPAGGLDRWVFGHDGCTIRNVVLGSQGALISQTCAKQDCAGLKFCGNGPQVLLRNGTDGRSDDDKDKANPDRIIWSRIGSNVTPVSADQVVSVADARARTLVILDSTKGTTLSRLTLTGASSTANIAQLATARAELIWIGGVSYSVELTGADFFWSHPTAGPPTATPQPGSLTKPVDLNEAIVLAPTIDGVDSLAPGTGAVLQHYPVGAPAQGSGVYPIGTGFVVAGGQTVVYQ
jgi:hypothetical protein